VLDGGSCRDVSRDVNNCGSIGNRCNDTEYCVSGACVCRPGLTDVGGNCVDLQTDPNNCGAAGNACGGGMVCAGGACHGSCPPGANSCGSSCVDFATDPLNCGDCGQVCNRDKVCVDGNCRDFRTGAGCTTCPCPGSCTGDTSLCCSYPATSDVICVDSSICP